MLPASEAAKIAQNLESKVAGDLAMLESQIKYNSQQGKRSLIFKTREETTEIIMERLKGFNYTVTIRNTNELLITW